MGSISTCAVLAALLAVCRASSIPDLARIAHRDSAADATSTCLLGNVVQTASALTGAEAGPTPGQSPSQTSENNFINFCSGKVLTNGLQNINGSCNPISMGDIPAQSHMISSIIVFPGHNDEIPAGQPFTVRVAISNLDAGRFTNPDDTYYSAPQRLNSQGDVIGHLHVVVQDMGPSLNPTAPLDPTAFSFFKGIDDGSGTGLLQATIADGLLAGHYRVCTMSGAENHQPPLMPVAQRGSQEDCTKFTVTAKGSPTAPLLLSAASTAADASAPASAATSPPADGGAFLPSALGGLAAPPISQLTDAQRPFAVSGNTFVDKDAAVERACAIQHNACASAADSGHLLAVTAAECQRQVSACAADLS